MILTHTKPFTVMPADCNHMNILFGGELLAMMDITAAECVRRCLNSAKERLHCLTVGLDKVQFKYGPCLGDIVFLNATIIAIGFKSLRVSVIGHLEKSGSGRIIDVCTGEISFVTKRAPDDTFATPHGLKL